MTVQSSVRRRQSRQNKRSGFGIDRLEDRRLLSAAVGLSTSRLVFTAVQNNAAAAQTVTITDTGDAPLTVSAITLAANATALGATTGANGVNRFSLANTPTLPATLQPGDTLSFPVGYTPTTKALDAATVQVATDDPATPTATVALSGIGATGTNGTGQPSLLRVLQAYNIPTQVGETDATNAIYPEPPASNSQEVNLQRLAKAGAGPVTLQVLASYTSTGVVPYTLGTYAAGTPTNKTELFHTLAAEFQSTTVHPQGSVQFDPGSNSFGMYFLSGGRTGYTDDALNTYDTTDPRKFRFFPLENPDGTVVPNAYVLTSTEYYTPAGYDFTNMVAILRNVTAAAGAPAGPLLSVTDPYAVPGSTNVLFNRIGHQNDTLGDTVHTVNTLTLSNTGTGPLTVSGYALSSQWSLLSPPAFPLTIAAGASTTLTVQFNAYSEPYHAYNQTSSTLYPNSAGIYNGQLTLFSNDAANPTRVVPFVGLYQYNSEHDNEPSLQTLVNLMFGWGTDISDTVPTPALGTDAAKQLYGEEVDSQYWASADATRPVAVTDVASWHTQGQATSFGWYQQPAAGATGTPTNHNLFTTGSDVGQTLFPATTNSNTAAASSGSFTTALAFGFKVNNNAGTVSWSGDALNAYPNSGGGHDVRFYPVRDGTGKLIPNTYLMANDYGLPSGENYDFQDNLYLISNVRPVAAPPAPSNLQAVATVANGAATVALTWAPATSATVTGYVVSRSSTPTGTYAPLATVTSTGYVDAAAPAGAVSYYKVTTNDSAFAGVTSQPANAVVSTVAGPVTKADYFSSMAGAAQAVNVLTNDADATSLLAPGTVHITTAPNHGGTAAVDATTGHITYTPSAAYSGVETLSYTVADAAGATSAATTVTFTVAAVPTTPPPTTPTPTPTVTPVTTNADFFTAVAGQAASLAVLSNDVGDVDPTTVVITTTSADGATVTVNPTTGAVTYTAPATFTGTDTFAYTVKDTAGVVSDPAIVSVAVSTTASGPLAVADAFPANTAAATPLDVLANDSDVNPAIALDPTTVAVVADPNHGGTVAVDPTTGVITYTSAAGFVGTETFSYTVGDANSTTSQPAVVTVTVTNPNGAPVASPDVVTAAAGGATTVPVLANDLTNGVNALNPASVTVTTAAAHGTATVNADGTVTYAPAAGFVGVDTFAYTVADAAGTVTAPATVTLNVPLVVGNAGGDVKSVTFTDADGTPVTLQLNTGTAQVFFTGTGTVATDKHNAATVTGTGLAIDHIVLTGTTAASALQIRTKAGGDGAASLGGLSDAAPLGKLIAPTTNLSGLVQLIGLSQMQVGNIAGATMAIGTGGPAAGVTIAAGTVTETALTVGQPVRSLKVAGWTQVNPDLGYTLSAPSIGTVTAVGDFNEDVTANAVAAVKVNGTVGGKWTIAGDLKSTTAGGVASTFVGAVTGTVNAMTVRAGGFAGRLTANRVNSLTVAGDVTSATITAASANAVRVTGNVTGTTLSFTGTGTSLNRLTVGGAIANSTLGSAGDVVALSAGSLSGSTIGVGVATGTTVAGATAATIGSATLGNLRLTARKTAALADSSVLAGTIKAAALGTVDGTGATAPFGVVAHALRSVTATVGSTAIRLSAKQLTDEATLQGYLATTGATFGEFEIKLV